MNVDERTPPVKITRNELYDKFPYLAHLSIMDMIQLTKLCFICNSDADLIYAIKCYLHSYTHELKNPEFLTKIFPRDLGNSERKNN